MNKFAALMGLGLIIFNGMTINPAFALHGIVQDGLSDDTGITYDDVMYVLGCVDRVLVLQEWTEQYQWDEYVEHTVVAGVHHWACKDFDPRRTFSPICARTESTTSYTNCGVISLNANGQHVFGSRHGISCQTNDDCFDVSNYMPRRLMQNASVFDYTKYAKQDSRCVPAGYCVQTITEACGPGAYLDIDKIDEMRSAGGISTHEFVGTYDACTACPAAGANQPTPTTAPELAQIYPDMSFTSPYDGSKCFSEVDSSISCYLPANVGTTDDTGTFEYTQNCYYTAPSSETTWQCFIK